MRNHCTFILEVGDKGIQSCLSKKGYLVVEWTGTVVGEHSRCANLQGDVGVMQTSVEAAEGEGNRYERSDHLDMGNNYEWEEKVEKINGLQIGLKRA